MYVVPSLFGHCKTETLWSILPKLPCLNGSKLGGRVAELGQNCTRAADQETRECPLARLREIVAAIQEQPSQKIIIEGHTDSTYTREYNLELFLQRAQALAGWLIEHGLPAGWKQ